MENRTDLQRVMAVHSEQTGGSSDSPRDPSQPGPSDPQPPSKSFGLDRLKKGSACVHCRFKKKRCDGLWPRCSTCIAERKDCVYKTWTGGRTRHLVEKIDALESRLAALQTRTSDSTSPPASAPDESVTVNLPQHIMPFTGEAFDVDRAISTRGEWWKDDPVHPAIQKYMLDIFMRQKDRPQFYFDLRRFWQSLSPTQSGPSPHPGLLNTMYLLACYWSGDSGLTALEPHFLSRARKYQSDTLQNPATNMLQWLQASTMIAYYLAAATGRFLEARQEISGTIPLILRCGLHKITSSDWRYTSVQHEAQVGASTTHQLLPAPRDNAEVGERVCIFWMAYAIELMIALLSGFAPNIELVMDTTTVWPREFDEYEQDAYTTTDYSPISLFGPKPTPPFDPPCSNFALRSKGMVLLAHVSVLALTCTPEYIRGAEFRTRFNDYHTSLTVFLEGLPPVVHSAPRSPTPGSSSATPPPPISPSLMAVHTLALYSFIQLFDAAGLESEIFNRLYSRRLALAKQAALLVRAFRSSGLPIGSLPATCTCCWFGVGRVLAQHIRRLQALRDVQQHAAEVEATHRDLTTVMEAMLARSVLVPVWKLMVERLQAYVNGGSEEELATHVMSVSPRRG